MRATLDDRRTLQLGPLWMLSGVSGISVHHAPIELASFWDIVVGVGMRTSEPARSLLTSVTEDRSGILLDFELDDRPIASGLQQVSSILDRSDPDLAEPYRRALMRIGLGVAKARGPYGRTITSEAMNVLLLLAELLQFELAPSTDDEALV